VRVVRGRREDPVEFIGVHHGVGYPGRLELVVDISNATVVLPDPTGPVTRSVGTGTLSPGSVPATCPSYLREEIGSSREHA
jgi:hypothetical protein